MVSLAKFLMSHWIIFSNAKRKDKSRFQFKKIKAHTHIFTTVPYCYLKSTKKAKEEKQKKKTINFPMRRLNVQSTLI